MLKSNEKTRRIASRVLGLLLSVVMLVTLLAPQLLFAKSEIFPDGARDNWIIDPAYAAGAETNEYADGMRHFVSGAGNANNPGSTMPAALVLDGYEMPESGYFEATILTKQEASKNRGGIYLNYQDPGNALLVGFDNGGWFWQNYNANGGSYYGGDRQSAPQPNVPQKIRLEWSGKSLTVATANGVDMFDTMPHDFSSIGGNGTKIGFKGGTYSAEYTDIYIYDVHYSGQDPVWVYDVAGTVTNEDGEAVADAIVTVGDKVVTSAADGSYSFGDVFLPGEYEMTVSADRYVDKTMTVTITDDDLAGVNMQLVYTDWAFGPGDGALDNWAQTAESAALGGTCGVEDGWLHLASTSSHANNSPGTTPPAVFELVGYEMPEEGYFEATLKFAEGARLFGLYMNYTDRKNSGYVGFDTQGIFWQRYHNAGTNDYGYFQSGDHRPAVGAETPIRVEWSTVGGVMQIDSFLFNGVEQISSPQQLDNVGTAPAKGIAIKCGSSASVGITDVLIKDIHYTGQALNVPAYQITGRVTDSLGVPLEGATVTGGNLSAVTGADGLFALQGLLPKSYVLEVSHEDYRAASCTVVVADRSQDTGDIALDDIISNFIEIGSDVMTVRMDEAFPRVLAYTDPDGDLLMYGQIAEVTQIELNAQNGSQNSDYYGREGVLVTPEVTLREGEGEEAGKVLYYDLAVAFDDIIEHKTVGGQTYNMPSTSTPVQSEIKIDAVITVKYTVEDNVLNLDIVNVQNNLDEKKWPITSIHFPGNSMVSVRATEEGADFAAARMSNNVASYGDYYGFNTPTNKFWAHYAFLTNNTAAMGIWSNSEMGLGGKDAERVIANVTGSGNSRVVGLQSNRFWYQTLIRGERSQTDTLYDYAFPELKNDQLTIDHLHNGKTDVPGWYLVEPVDMPHASVAIAIGDVNDDAKVDWQDAAIESRQLFPELVGGDEVPETVGWRIAQNFSGQAGNPFLLTLDNIKRVSLQTDGLGQGVLHKGYGNEGHDSGHPDFWDIGTRMGGADEFNYLLEKAQEYGARIGIHCNTGEMYPEAKAWDDEFVRRSGGMNSTESSPLRLGWNWLDQGVGLDGRFDQGSGRRYDRWSRLKDALEEDPSKAVATGLDNFPDLGIWSKENESVKSKLSFVYLDIWGNNTDSENNQWATRQVLYEINRLGWNFASEWGYLAEGRGIMQHWATDLLYGASSSKGNNSSIMRFLRNHQSDSWVAEHSSGSNYGFASTAPLLGGANMKDFEGWQGRNSYSAYVDNFWAFNVSTKFLQHFTVNQLEFGQKYNSDFTPETFVQLVSDGDTGWFNPAGDVVEVTRGSDTYVGTYGSNQALPPENIRQGVIDYRSRTITLNGKKILEGEMAVDATTGTVSTSHTRWLPMLRSEKYLIPWVWDSVTGEKLPLAQQRLYHYNQDIATPTTTWELPDEWLNAGVSTVYVYELSDTGRGAEKAVPVVDGSITLTAEQRKAYVVYAQSTPKQTAEEMNWGDGIHVADANFNSMDLEGAGWTLETAAGDEHSIEMDYTFVEVPQVRMRGNASMTTDVIDLNPNTGYVVYVNVDNRSLGDATMELLYNGEVIDSVYTNTSIAPNYVRTDPHSANNPTTSASNIQSMYQRMFLFFETPGAVADGDYELRLSHKKGESILWPGNPTLQDAVFWDNIRVTENDSVGDKANIKATKVVDGKTIVSEYYQDFENMACGLYPFVMGSAWGVEDNRAHLSELHAPYTQGGWDVKLLDDVITNGDTPGGNWSVKVNGTPTAGRTVMQTIPQLFRFEPGLTYEVSFDYEMGSPDTFRFVVGDGNLYNPDASTGSISNTSTTVPSANRIQLLGEALGVDDGQGSDVGPKRFTYTVTGAESGQTWVGIVRHSNALSQSSNFVGRADFVLDNLRIKLVGDEVDREALQALYDALKDTENNNLYTTGSWATFAEALDAAKAVLDAASPSAAEVEAAYDGLVAAHDDLAARALDYELAVLGTFVTLYESYIKAMYTPESWAILQDAMTVAKALIADPANASSAAVSKATTDLIAAGNNLDPALSKSPLEGAIADAQALLAEGNWIPASADNLQKAIDKAEALLEKADLTQAEMVSMILELNDAMSNMFEKGNKASLQLLVNSANRLDGDLFTADSWTVFSGALTAAQTVLGDTNATADEVVAAYSTLSNAISQLVPKANPSGLKTALDLANTILANADKYVPASIEDLQAEADKAQLVYENANATQSEIDAAQTALMAKVMGARKPANKEALKGSLGRSSNLAGQLSQAGLETLNEAVAKAQQIANDPAATQEAVDEAAKAVEQAALAPVIIKKALAAPYAAGGATAANPDAAALPAEEGAPQQPQIAEEAAAQMAKPETNTVPWALAIPVGLLIAMLAILWVKKRKESTDG